ncbi:hypothetical protein DSO57_1003457 [Entomophthora muscae]|uniref:Uncharacterized protein n=1 Tax=Entomophthora muscae TaxID=34485 RepID=A0ACC2UTQ6_9FUNG|nr:hypothetical protein DSO57_1003457 [Entomophthora muscae]
MFYWVFKVPEASHSTEIPPVLSKALNFSGTSKNAISCTQVCGFYPGPCFTYDLIDFSGFLVQLSFSAHCVGNNPTCLLHLLEDLLERAQDLFSTSVKLVKSLTCDGLDLFLPDLDLKAPCGDNTFEHAIPVKKPEFSLLAAPVLQEHAPKCSPWLLEGMVLMGLNLYFLQISHMSSLWTPV